NISVAPKLTGLKAGIYDGQVIVTFNSSGTQRRVAILLIVLPASSAAPVERGAAGCTPGKLLLEFSALGQSFTQAVAWPVGLEVTVGYGWGPQTTSGGVAAFFSNGDAPTPLNSPGGANSPAPWGQKNPATAVTITAMAQTTSPALAGTTTIGGASTTNPG